MNYRIVTKIEAFDNCEGTSKTLHETCPTYESRNLAVDEALRLVKKLSKSVDNFNECDNDYITYEVSIKVEAWCWTRIDKAKTIFEFSLEWGGRDWPDFLFEL